jgi:hypothetical protein
MKAGLTFHWPDYRKVSFALPGFILLSIFIHGISFTLFQVVYPPSGSLRPPPASVTLLTPSTPENRALLIWVAAGDPSLTSKPVEIVPPGLFDLQYQPSYAELYTEPKLVETPPGIVGFPPIMDAQHLVGSLVRNRSGSPVPEIAPHPTQMRVSEGLLGRAPKADGAGTPHVFANKSSVNLEAAQFLVGVNAAGGVAYVFLQHSSGESKIDREAESLVTKTRFAPASAMSWGMISFCWGNDIFDPSTRTAGAP